MPYLRPEHKAELDPAIDCLVTAIAEHVFGAESDDDRMAEAGGLLNYCFNMLAYGILMTVPDRTRYAHLERLLGTFEAAKLEFWFKVIRPYEDKRAEENGEVYPT